MRKGQVFVGVAFAILLSGQSLEAGTVSDDGKFSGRILGAAISGMEGLLSLVRWSAALPLRADGGDGEGGGSDGEGSDGGGSNDGGVSSDSTGTGTGDGTGDGVSASVGPDDPAADPSTDPDNVTVAPTDTTDPTDPTNITPELNAIMSIPTTDPRGSAVTPTTTPTATDDALDDVPVGAPGASGSGGVAPVDVGIHAVIVSGAMTPWDAIGKVPGVGTVTVTGGIVALGTTPIRGEPPGGGPQPSWLRLVPDLNLLDGSVIPPVVPNVIDVRITRYSVEAVEKPNN